MLQLEALMYQQEDVFFKPKRGLLRIYGPDARSFLQRMSTGNIEHLTKENPCATCFINNKGKVVAVAGLFERGFEDIVLIASGFDSDLIHKWLLGFHFAEDLSFDAATFEPYFIVATTKPHRFAPCLKLGQFEFDNHLWSLLLNHAPMPSAGVLLDDIAFDTVRIMACMPEYPSEINEHHLPDTLGLAGLVADNKGCYIGQEVISKARVYQKHKKNLVGHKLSQEEWQNLKPQSVSPGHEFSSVAPLYVQGSINALGFTSLQHIA